VLRYVFVAYLAAMIAAYIVPSEIGGNIVRLRFIAIPLAILVLSLRRWRPLAIGVALVAGAVAWNLTPLAESYVNNSADVTANQTTWPAAIAFLHTHLGPSYRVEAVDTAGHWPAVYLADAGIPIARGWFRQDDFPQNAVLYTKLGPRTYLRWLRSLGVRYVVLADAPSDYSSRAEKKLLRSGRSGLTPVFYTHSLTIYAVPHPRSIVTGPGHPVVTSLTGSHLKLVVYRGGTYRIAVRWSPYWRTSKGCLTAGKDGMMRLRTLGPQKVGLMFRVDAIHALDTLAGETPECTFAR
jgi:hypothetical protein